MDQHMALTWGLCYMALVALCWRYGVTKAEETVPLKTLQCYNDYTEHIICSWADTEDAHGLVNLTLYHWLEKKQPVPCELSETLMWSECPSPHRCVPRRCVIPYTQFSVSKEDYYSLQPDRDPQIIQLVVPLAQHVQPPPPKDIRISPSGDHFLLEWSVPLGDPQVSRLSQKDIQFEVAYKRLQDSWEDASSLHTSNLSVTLKPKLFLPNSIYVARVRTQLSPGSSLSGRASRWSPEVHWDSQTGDKAQPQNLQCFFDGIQSLNCSWEVWTQVTSSVSFGLFYSPSPEVREKKCSPVVKELQASLYTRYHCSLNVSDPAAHNQYTVAVKRLEQGKFIESFNHIQMNPPTLNVTKNRDSYSLHWETQKMSYPFIQHAFQVQYKKKLDSWEDSKTENLNHAHSMDLPQLEPGTSYCARVRVKTIPEYEYNGLWSEWSEECTWTTDWVMPTLWIVLILVFLILTLLLVYRFGCVYGCRLYRKWKEKIPNPSKSLLFQDGGKGLWPPGSTVTLSTKNPTPQGPQSNLFSELQGVSYTHLEDNEVSPLTIEDPNIIRDPPSGPDTTPAASSEPMEQSSGVQVDPPTPSVRPRKQLPSFDFNGPYLGPPQSHSLPDLPGQLVSPQGGGSLKPALPGSLEYMCLPPGGQVHLVPLSQVMGQGRVGHVQCGSSLETTESPSTESRESPPVQLKEEKQEPRDNPVTLPISSGGPEDSKVASEYVTPADLVLTLPTEPLSTSLGPSLELSSSQSPSLCLKQPRVPFESPALELPVFEDYVELPPSMSQPAKSPPDNPAPPVPSSLTVSPGEPREEVGTVSPHPEGLLVLQQVGDYCFLPGLGPGPLSPPSKPPPPGLCLETEDLDKDLSVKKLPYQPIPQVPAIQFFKSLKHQDYLSLPPWDNSQPGKVC